MAIDTTQFKARLEEEQTTLEGQLNKIGRINPNNPSDWEPTGLTEDNNDHADPNITADHIEGYRENAAMLKELETRYNNIKRALEKIENGTYGVCEVSGEEIEADRLEANPAARTCKAHLNDLEPKL